MPSTRVTEHLAHHLGSGQHVEDVGDVALWRYERPEFVSVATHGLAAAGHGRPQELVCSVRPGQEEQAAVLVRSTVQMLVAGSEGLADGQLVDGGGPLEGTEITGVVAASHPYLGSGLGRVAEPDAADAGDDPTTEVITLVPLTAPELALARESGADALFDALESANAPLLDLARPSAVTPPAQRRRFGKR